MTSADTSLREQLRTLQAQLEEKFAIIQDLSVVPAVQAEPAAWPSSSPKESVEGVDAASVVLLEMKFDLPFAEMASDTAKEDEFKQQLIDELFTGFSRLEAPGCLQ